MLDTLQELTTSCELCDSVNQVGMPGFWAMLTIFVYYCILCSMSRPALLILRHPLPIVFKIVDMVAGPVLLGLLVAFMGCLFNPYLTMAISVILGVLVLPLSWDSGCPGCRSMFEDALADKMDQEMHGHGHHHSSASSMTAQDSL
jgi:hypothetical protein